MIKIPKWQYDEFKHCGVDFSDSAEVERYENKHRQIRDFKKEASAIIDSIGLGREDKVIDMGCGTGAFTLNAADKCGKIFAVDVSKAMLDLCRKKCRGAKIANVEFFRAGFLSYEHKAKPVDAIVSKLAMHHLPDFWKQIALRRLAQMLRKNGKFYLWDIVYSFDIKDYEKNTQRWISKTAPQGDRDFKRRFEVHISQEFSTMDWVMEKMLEIAGFKILKKNYNEGFFAEYVCIKL